jgi:hypothetical protein
LDLSILEQQASEHFTHGRLRAAARAYVQLCRHLPERLDVQARLGYLALLGNDLDEAVAHLAKAINDGLRSRQTLAHLAEAYYRQGQLGSAAYCYQRLGRDGLAGTLAVMAELDAYRLLNVQSAEELSWITDSPLPVLSVSVNGHTANLVLDTGAGDTVLDTRFAVEAGVLFGGREQRAFAGQRLAPVTYGHLEALCLGDMAIQDTLVQVIDIPSEFDAWFPELPIHGILGINVLSRFRATLDYHRGRLHLETPAMPGESTINKRSPERQGTPLWLAENQLLLTCIDLPAQDQGVWFLDTGMTGAAFALPESGIESLQLESDATSAFVGTGGGGTIQGHKVRADWLRLDRLCQDSPQGVVLDAFTLGHSCGFTLHGLIGHDLFGEAILTLDFPAMQLHATAFSI